MIIWIALGWHLGIALAGALPLAWWLWALLAGLGLVATVFTWRWLTWRSLMVVLLTIGLGGWRMMAVQPAADDETQLAFYNDAGRTWLDGVVVGEPDVRETHANLRVWVSEARVPAGVNQSRTLRLTDTVVLVRAPVFPEIAYGASVQVVGPLEGPPRFEGFDYADYLARQGVFSVLRAERIDALGPAQCPNDLPGYGLGDCGWFAVRGALFAFKGRALAVLTRVFPAPLSALVSGILLGVDSGLPADLQAAFRATGTTHIIAISGFNIVLISTIVMRLTGGVLSKRGSIWAAVAVVVVYTLLAGADGSVVRSAVMAMLVLLTGGLARGGRNNGIYALTTAAVLITIANPLWLWDVGFQLSVAATLGLIIYADGFTTMTTDWLSARVGQEQAQAIVAAVGEYTTVTLAAQVTTLPLIAYYFNEVSVISLVANLIILPVQPALMVLAGLAMLLGLVWLPLGQLVALAAWPFGAFTVAMVRLLGSAPGAALPLPRFSWVWLALAYGALAAVTWLWLRKPERRPAWWDRVVGQWLPGAALAALALFVFVAWQAVFSMPDGRLHVRFLDVGDGQATLIQTPGGRYVLIDGGPSPGVLADGLGELLPLTQRELDLVLVTQAQDAHVAGLVGLLDRIEMRQVVMLGEPGFSRSYQAWMEGLAERQINVWEPGGETVRYDLGDGAQLAVISQGAERTLVAVTYGRARFLFAPNLTTARSLGLAVDGVAPPATVLLAPGQGGVDTLSREFVAAANPWVVVLAVSASNPDGAPAPETLDRLAGYNVLRTDQHGWIEVVTDGEQIWVTSAR